MRFFPLSSFLFLLLASSHSNADRIASRKLQDDSESPTAAPLDDGLDSTFPPTAAVTSGMTDGETEGGTDGTDGDFDGDGDGLVNTPAPSPVDDFGEGGSPAPTVADEDGMDMSAPPTSEMDDLDASAPPTTTTDNDEFDNTAPPTEVYSDEMTPSPTPGFEPTPTQPSYYEQPQTRPPTYFTEAPSVGYIPNDDDPLQDDGEAANWNSETIEEMEHDKNVLIALSVVGAIGLCLALISAQQVIENPDGCCARAMCGCTNSNRRNHDLILASDNNYTHDLELS